MSVNCERPQMCSIPGCARSATHYGCLCYEHWTAAWLAYQESVIVLPDDEDTQPVPTFDADCAHAFDIEMYAPGDDPHHAAPSRIIPAWHRNGNGNGRNR